MRRVTIFSPLSCISGVRDGAKETVSTIHRSRIRGHTPHCHPSAKDKQLIPTSPSHRTTTSFALMFTMLMTVPCHSSTRSPSRFVISSLVYFMIAFAIVSSSSVYNMIVFAIVSYCPHVLEVRHLRVSEYPVHPVSRPVG